jgi:hypothetical protein
MAIQVLLSQAGPLPINVSFSAPGDSPMYIEVSGSVWSQNTDKLIGIAVSLDGQAMGKAQVFSNGPATHRAVVPAYIPVKLTQGQHTITLAASTTDTVSDYNDYFTAVIHY